MSNHYDVVALQITIYYNRDGDHDHNGMIFALKANAPILRYLNELSRVGVPLPAGVPAADPAKHLHQALIRAAELEIELPMTPQQARQPHPLVRPLVLRTRRNEPVTVTLENEIRDRDVGIHLVGRGYDVTQDDGSVVGNNPSSLVPQPPLAGPPNSRTYTWTSPDEGVFPFHDGGNYSGGEDGTNVHGLFGALVVEPKGTTWRDPITGRGSHGDTGTGPFEQIDGLYLDILPAGLAPNLDPLSETTLADHQWPDPQPYRDFETTAHREFVIVFHDEPEFDPPHETPEPNPCQGSSDGHAGHDEAGNDVGHDGDHGFLPIMPISYRAEPMINRERRLWRLLRTGHVLGRPVLNEEQHHSSWMFGDPATPILRAYIGDLVRIRLVHAGVKETHVFHLHLYEWHALAGNTNSPRIDAISFSPQTGHTIEPVWGAGNRQQVAGDAIWHCHLYPHFHEGMWGILRTFETRQHGEDGPRLKRFGNPVYQGRRIGRYPDGTKIDKLLPLPGQPLPPNPSRTRPGFPLYIPGQLQQKSPRPPWPDRDFEGDEVDEAQSGLPCNVVSLKGADMPPEYDYRRFPTQLERRAFNERPVPGELFTRNRVAKQQAAEWAADPDFERNRSREVCHDAVVAMRAIEYNSHGWHDKHGHLFYLSADGDPADRPGPMGPLFLRAQHGQIVNITLRNDLPETIEETAFDHAFPPCPALPWEGECATHVHMVKFDPICADGASVGWNYMSGARFGRKMVYRWWADQEFGTIFFHDHLFANYRQKHGLFAALLVEPRGATFLHHLESGREIITGTQALIRRHEDDTAAPRWFREFCIGIGDFIPAWDRSGRPLNPPAVPGGHGDQGVMGLNYRNAPLRERPGNPAHWFSSALHGDPDTTLFTTYAGDPMWLRLVQGSHEEQHSFQIHGLRWQRFRDQLDSQIRNQQTMGIAEAFTFINSASVQPGDYLYKLSGADDLWLGCWGIIRAIQRPDDEQDAELPSLDPIPHQPAAIPPTGIRRFWVEAKQISLNYRDDIVDPFALIYEVTQTQGPDDDEPVPVAPVAGATSEPLVLWCREGEQVVVELSNSMQIATVIEPEPFAPEVPVERPERPVSTHVSMHADLVQYDIASSDGANVGLNPAQTVPPTATRSYTWDTHRPTNADEPLGPVLLQDMADVRNHRHHGLIGALVVLPENATPYAVTPGQTTATGPEVWYGARVTVRRENQGTQEASETEEMVLLLQDGLRLFLNGQVGFPLPDPPEEPGEADKEDQGQKGVNYRTEPRGQIFDPQGSDDTLGEPNPATPVWHVPVGKPVRFHLVGGLDKPRNYSFTIHGVAWPEDRFGPQPLPMVSSESAISCGTARTFEFTPDHEGDHAYRAGVLRWAVPQGMWGILRVEATPTPSLGSNAGSSRSKRDRSHRRATPTARTVSKNSA